MRYMRNAGEWPEATRIGAMGLGKGLGLGPELPKQRLAVAEEDPGAEPSDFSLASLVRQWMVTSDAVERRGRPEGDDSPIRPTWTPPKEDVAYHEEGIDPVVKHSSSPGPAAPVDPADPLDQAGPDTEASPEVLRPALPRRRRQPQPGPTRRMAVLIDAETTPPESAGALFDALADQGIVSVCRAYADWTSPGVRGWWTAPLRQHGIQPHHHFGHAQDQRALVALTIDAVDLARESAVDTVTIVGDLVPLQPLVVRLNAAGLQVLAFGTTPTPHDVRSLCHGFVDLSSPEDPGTVPGGRHRA